MVTPWYGGGDGERNDNGHGAAMPSRPGAPDIDNGRASPLRHLIAGMAWLIDGLRRYL
jgi:hypothetical protein